MTDIVIDGQSYELERVNHIKPEWEVTLNGKPVDNVDTLTVINHDMGIGFLYGKSPAGPYNQGRLVNRGGSVIVVTVQSGPYKKLYMLALEQVRPLVGQAPILEFPRGQANINEKSIDTAKRELLEETGLPLDEGDLMYLGNGNPDTALIHGTNVHTWWLQLPSWYFDLDENGTPRLRSDIEANPESKLIESIKKAVFVPATEFKSPSQLTSNAAGLVFQQLYIESRKTDEIKHMMTGLF